MDLADEARVGRDELDDLLLCRVGLARRMDLARDRTQCLFHGRPVIFLSR